MEMPSNLVIERICRLAEDFAGAGRSIVEMVGPLLPHLETLSRDDVAVHLRKHPSLVEAWLRWSADQRSSSGWYFRPEERQYVVAFYPTGPREVFDDIALACATYVFHVFESLVGRATN